MEKFINLLLWIIIFWLIIFVNVKRLKQSKIPIFRPQQIVATDDHNTPTKDQHLPVKDELSRNQLKELSKNSLRGGYVRLCLSDDKGITRTMTLHRLVA